MKKVIGYRKVKASALAITLAAAITLSGCEYTGDLFHDIKSGYDSFSSGEVQSVSIPKSIEPLEFYEETYTVEKEHGYYTEKEEKTVKKMPLNSLIGINAYLTYTIEGENIFYSCDFLIPVVTEDYIAYYKALDGDLEKVELLEGSKVNPKNYKSYINKGIVELGKVENELYNPNYSDVVNDGIDFDNNTITRQSYVYMELGYLSKHKEDTAEIINNLYKEKGLK